MDRKLLLSLLASLGPVGLMKILGGDPAGKLRSEAARLSSAMNVGNVADRFYRLLLSSPAYSQAQGTIAAGANQTANALASELGARGIGPSGTGAVLSALVPSLVGSQTAELRTKAHRSAQERAADAIRQQIEALTQGPPPSQSAQLLAGGFDSLGPLLDSLLKSGIAGPRLASEAVVR
jgi:hypothetical protein